MFIFMENRIELFIRGFKRWARTKPHKKPQTELADIIGKSQPTISDYFNFKYLPEPEDIEKWIKEYDLDENEIVEIGRKALVVENPDPNEMKISFNDFRDQVMKILSEGPAKGSPDADNIISIEQKHLEVIKKFQQKELALSINHELLTLENIDPSRLDKVLDYIEYQKNKAKKEVQKRDVKKDKQ